MLRNYTSYAESLTYFQSYIPYLAFIIAVFSALRLAKFNIDERQTTSFLGLPTPANAIFWVSYVYGMYNVSTTNNWVLFITLVLIPSLSLLMVSEVPMFSFKMKNIKFKGNEKPLLLMICAIGFLFSMWSKWFGLDNTDVYINIDRICKTSERFR